MWSWMTDVSLIFSTFLTGLIESVGIICDESDTDTTLPSPAKSSRDETVPIQPCCVLHQVSDTCRDERSSCPPGPPPRTKSRRKTRYTVMPTWSLVQRDPRLWAAMRNILRANLFVTLLAITTSQLSMWHLAPSDITSPSPNSPFATAGVRADPCGSDTCVSVGSTHSCASSLSSSFTSRPFSFLVHPVYNVARRVRRVTTSWAEPSSSSSSSCAEVGVTARHTGYNISFASHSHERTTHVSGYLPVAHVPSPPLTHGTMQRVSHMRNRIQRSFALLASASVSVSLTFPLGVLLRLFVWFVMYSGQWPLFVTFQLAGLLWYAQLYSETWLLRKGFIITRSPVDACVRISSAASSSSSCTGANKPNENVHDGTCREGDAHAAVCTRAVHDDDEQRVVCDESRRRCRGCLGSDQALHPVDGRATSGGVERTRVYTGDEGDGGAGRCGDAAGVAGECTCASQAGKECTNTPASSDGVSRSTRRSSSKVEASSRSDNCTRGSVPRYDEGGRGRYCEMCALIRCLVQCVWHTGQLFVRLIIFRLPPTPQAGWIVGDRRAAERQLRWQTSCSLDQRLRAVSEMWFKFCATFLFSWFIVVVESFSPCYLLGKALGFVLNALLFSFYVLDYRYSTQLLSARTRRVRLTEQITHFERHWAYYIGYGALATTCLYLVTATAGSVASVCVGTIVYAWQVVCSGYTRPRLATCPLPVFTPWFCLVDRMRKLSLGLLWRIAAVLLQLYTLRCLVHLLSA